MMWPLTRSLMSDPFPEMKQMQRQINRLFEGGLTEDSYPPVSVWANEENLVLTAELPGIDKNEIDITVNGDQLTLEGEKKVDSAGDDAKFIRRERRSGRFVRHFQLPYEAESAGVTAAYKDGILMVKVPRAEATKPRKISIG